MKRMLLIYLLTIGFVLIWAAVIAEDGFYVIATKKQNFAPVEKTGVIKCYNPQETDCSGTGQDGEYQKGVSWPNPRFTDNQDGTVTDNLTGLIWFKDLKTYPGGRYRLDGPLGWHTALELCSYLEHGVLGLSDGSSAGDWRLPNIKELQSLIHYGYNGPALPDTVGTGQWTEGDPFIGIQSNYYWTSNTNAGATQNKWQLSLGHGGLISALPSSTNYVWPVRGGNER